MTHSEAQIVKALIKQFKDEMDNLEDHAWSDHRCLDCTLGTTPHGFFCGYHAAKRLLRGEEMPVIKDAI